MQQQERDLIAGLFDRLRPYEAQARDPEAEALIKEQVARQPSSPYLLVQAVLVQEQALKAAQERIAELEAKPGSSQAASGFLGSAPKLGPWGAQPEAQPEPSRPPAPSTRSPLQAAVSGQQAGGGGFLRTALATAAGVAGGALLFEGIRNLISGSPGAFGPALAQTPSSLLPPDTPPQDAQPQQTAFDDTNNLPQDDQQLEDYDSASLDQDQDFGGSDDDSWA